MPGKSLKSTYLTDGLEGRSRQSERAKGETEATVPNFLATRYSWQTRDASLNIPLSGAHDSNVAQLKHIISPLLYMACPLCIYVYASTSRHILAENILGPGGRERPVRVRDLLVLRKTALRAGLAIRLAVIVSLCFGLALLALSVEAPYLVFPEVCGRDIGARRKPQTRLGALGRGLAERTRDDIEYLTRHAVRLRRSLLDVRVDRAWVTRRNEDRVRPARELPLHELPREVDHAELRATVAIGEIRVRCWGFRQQG